MRRLRLSWCLSLLLGLAAFASPAPAFAGARLPPSVRAAPPHWGIRADSLLSASQPVSGTVFITAIDPQAFPAVNVYLAVNDATGQHVAGLPAGSIRLTENSAPIAPPGLSASEKEVGVEMVFAIDTSPLFKTRDINAVTRLDYIRQALQAFATQAAPGIKDGIDDVTLLAPEGVLIAHTSRGQDLANALAGYSTSFAGAADPLPLVNQALDYASETMARPGMARYVILFSNGLLSKGQAAPLADVVARAQAAQINVAAVYVGQPGTSDSPGGQSLQKLAGLMHGQFLVLDKPEALAPLLQHLADQRLQYQLSYRSAITVTGQVAVSATVTLPDGSQVASNASAFPLRVEPPTVALPSLPAVLPLAPPSAGVAVTYSVPVAVDFPDGHPRRLQALELVVDGQVADTQPAPPLNWNLTPYSVSGVHTLLARATDELGLVAESAPLTITLSFSEAPRSAAVLPSALTAVSPMVAGPASNRWIVLTGVGLLLAAVCLGGFWLASRRLRSEPAEPPPFKAEVVGPGEATRPMRLPPAPPPPPVPRPSSFTLFPRRRAGPAARPQGRAYLEVVEGGGLPRGPIEILGPALRLGRDGTQAEVVFQDRSVSRLHAHITEEADGHFRIYDEGSTSGTWVNFTQIPAEGGLELKPGDIINLGRVQLRFKLRDRAKSPPPPPSQTRPPAPPGQAKPPAPHPQAGRDDKTLPFRPPKRDR
jgi:hypothetical protein